MRKFCVGATVIFFCLALISLLNIPFASAQGSSVAPRIFGPVDEYSVAALQGTVSPIARKEFDRGQVDTSMLLSRLQFFFSRTPGQQADLDNFLAAQIDPSLPGYHKWLTPEQFGQRFGAADSDIQAVKAWLESRGFEVGPIPAARTYITFSGTAGQVQKAFQTPIHMFQRNGERFYANTSELQVPVAFSALIGGVLNFNSAPFHHFSHQASLGKWDSATRALTSVSESSSAPAPQLTTGSPGSYFLYVVPADAATIYNTPNTLNSSFAGGSMYTGTGVRIAIAGQSVIQASTVRSYRTRFIGDSTPPTIINVDGVTATTDTGEAYIDNELAGGLAPGATITYYTAKNVITAVEQAVSDNTSDIISLSYGLCESLIGQAANQSWNTIAAQAAAQGITITVSTGDSGAAGCDNDNSVQTASQGLQVNGLASTPYTVAVGGTDYYGLLNHQFPTYANPTANAFYGTAKGYIPEATWNDSTTNNGALSQNVPFVNSRTNQTDIVGGSGGRSSCVTKIGSACSAGYSKPTWQRGASVPSDSVRDIPDVSLFAGNGFDRAAWLVCTDDTTVVNGVNVTHDCSTQADNNFYFVGYGGTSTAAPAFAGILAMVEQKTGGRLGTDVLKKLYDLYNGAHASAVFHDTVQGNNSMVCAQATPDCAQNTAGNYFLTGYDTTTGYDLATGLGSVDAGQLITYWGSATSGATPTITAAPSSNRITDRDALSLTVTVGGTAGTPTGSVSVTSGAYNSGAHSLVSGSYTFNIPAGSLAAGSDTLTVTYSGDAAYNGGSQTAAVTVVQLSTPTITVVPAPTTITPAQALSVAVTVIGGPAGTPTGTVTLSSGTYNSGAQTLVSGAFTFNVPAGSLIGGQNTLTVTYSGDNNYSGGTQIAGVTVQAATPTIAVVPTPSVITTSQALSVAATVSGGAGTPTGTVTLSSGAYNSGAKAMVSGAYTFNIAAGVLPVGTDSLTVTYSGDSSYNGGSQTATVTVKQLAAPNISLVPTPSVLNATQTLSVVATLSGSSGTPTGTVSLASGSYNSGDQALVSGKFTFSVPPGSLAVGTDTLTLTYSGDTNYASAHSSTTVAVNPRPTAALAVAPLAPIFSSQPLNVAVSIVGFNGVSAPSGTINLTSGSYTSSAVTIVFGAATITVPANTLPVGSDSLTLTYSGDATYPPVTAIATATVKAPYTLNATAPAVIAKGGTATSTLTITADPSYTGTLTLGCALTTPAPGAVMELPACSITSGSSVTVTAGTANPATATISITSTAAHTALQPRGVARWARTGAGAILALLVFFGIPARRRAWRNLVGLVVLLTAFGAISACGGGGGGSNSNGGGSISDPGTISGAYVFTVTATGSPAVNPAPTTTISLTIN